MRHPKILYRPMFSTKGSSSYGKGIASNLVTEEQRVKYNSGGRVGLWNGSDYSHLPVERIHTYDRPTSFGENPQFYRRLPPGTPVDPGAMHQINQLDLGDMYTRENLYPKWEKTWQKPKNWDELPQWQGTDLIGPYMESEEEEMMKLKEADPVQFEKMYETWAKEKYGTKKRKQKELFESAGITSDFLTDKPGMVSPDTGASIFDTESLEQIKTPAGTEEWLAEDQETEVGEYPGTESRTFKEQLSEDVEVAPVKKDPFAFLDESLKKKRKMGLGKGFMDAAAAAVEWSGAGTKKEKSAAIAKGFRGMGEAGVKYVGEAMDLKDRAKILSAIEDKKTEGKMSVQEAKNAYGMALNTEAYRLSGLNKAESQKQALKDKIAFNEYAKGTRKEQQDAYLQGEKWEADAVAKALRHYANKPAMEDPGEAAAKKLLTKTNEGLLIVYDDGRIMQVTESEEAPDVYIYKNVSDSLKEFLL